MKKKCMLILLSMFVFIANIKQVYALEDLVCKYNSNNPSGTLGNFATKIEQSNSDWVLSVQDSDSQSTGWMPIYYNYGKQTVKVLFKDSVILGTSFSGLSSSYYSKDEDGWISCPKGLTVTTSSSSLSNDGFNINFHFNNSGNNLYTDTRNLETDKNVSPTSKLDYNNLCSSGNTGIMNAIKIIGTVVSICKWIVPMLIIVFGMLDFGKAVISNDDNAMNKATKSLITRIIVGVVVGLLPTVILSILGLLETLGAKDIYKNNFGACTKCILDVSECE